MPSRRSEHRAVVPNERFLPAHLADLGYQLTLRQRHPAMINGGAHVLVRAPLLPNLSSRAQREDLLLLRPSPNHTIILKTATRSFSMPNRPSGTLPLYPFP